MIGILGNRNSDVIDNKIDYIQTDLYDKVRNIDPYQENEVGLHDTSFLLMDISVDGYDSVESKDMTYNIATNVYQNGCTILDAGSGLGDLYSFMDKRFSAIHDLYTAVDFNSNKINLLNDKYGDVNSICMDIIDIDGNYDYVFALNVFNDMIYNDMNSYLVDSVDKLFSITNKCLVFNVLNEKTKLDYEDDSTNIYSFDLITDILKRYDFFIHRTEYIHGESMIYIFKPESM